MQINYDYDMIVTMIMVVTSKDESECKKKTDKYTNEKAK